MRNSKQHLDQPAELIKKCRQGSQQAQFELYKLYYKAMFNTSYRIVKNLPDAEDIMQEAFLKAFQNLGSYKAEVSFGAWLKRIVVNQSLDYLRKRKVELVPIEHNLDNKAEEENSYPDELDIKIKLDKVLNEINALPDGYRVILTLYLIEGYDHDEISEILKISPSTSRSQYMRGKERVLKNIKLRK